MFTNPKTAIESGWIKGIRDADKQVQPNAIDFTLDQIKSLAVGSPAVVTEDRKTMRKLFDIDVNPAGLWQLNHGTVYDGMSDMYVEVPDGQTAVLFTRSTLARNGTFLVSGLYDSGYKGHIGFTLYPLGGSIAIAPGTRVGQIAFMSADAAKQYAGGYNHAENTHYTEPEAAVAKVVEAPAAEAEPVVTEAPTKKEKKNVKQEPTPE